MEKEQCGWTSLQCLWTLLQATPGWLLSLGLHFLPKNMLFPVCNACVSFTNCTSFVVVLFIPKFVGQKTCFSCVQCLWTLLQTAPGWLLYLGLHFVAKRNAFSCLKCLWTDSITNCTSFVVVYLDPNLLAKKPVFPVCNACGLYYKLHQVGCCISRPTFLLKRMLFPFTMHVTLLLAGSSW